MVQVIGFGEPSLLTSNLWGAVFHVAQVLDFSFLTGMLFLTVLLTTSIAGSLEQGEMRLLASFPLSRNKILLTKILVNFGVFFLVYAFILCILLGALAPAALLWPIFVVLLLGIAAYQLFFTSIAVFIAVITKNIKISLLVVLIFCLAILLGLNMFILRGGAFLTTLVVTYGELFWEGFIFSSSVEVPFLPVLVVHGVMTALLFGITLFQFRRMEL